MTESRWVEIEGAGRVLFERSRRARRLNIVVRHIKGVRVAVPWWMPFEEALEIVHPRVGWIEKHRERQERERERQAPILESLPPLEAKEARARLTARLKELADRHGFSYNRVFIRNQKTRWGSCSGKNNINLNMKLARLPGELIDYVILHELAHTRIKNHGSGFWALMNELVENARAIDARMKGYPLALL